MLVCPYFLLYGEHFAKMFTPKEKIFSKDHLPGDPIPGHKPAPVISEVIEYLISKISPLNPQYKKKKQTVFQKISAFVEKFKGVGGEI